MQINLQRYFLLFTGVTLMLIGIAYCIDPNLLLARYDLSATSASEDNMYRGAYGGLFITVGAAVAYGFRSAAFRFASTVFALVFMGGFAIGRIASIALLGMPHQMIINLLVFEIVSSGLLIWFLFRQPSKTATQ